MAKLNATLTKVFNKEDGPFIKALDAALEDFQVRRQSYHGVGNHVHQTLKVSMGTIIRNAYLDFALSG